MYGRDEERADDGGKGAENILIIEHKCNKREEKERMKKDIEKVAVEVTELQSLLHVVACYLGEAMNENPNVDRVNSSIMQDAVHGIADYAGRLSEELSDIATEETTCKKMMIVPMAK